MVTVWTMVDAQGEVLVKDWSGSTFIVADFLDKAVRLRRVRVTTSSNGASKGAEFLPGLNGSLIAVVKHPGLQSWWLGE